MKSSVCISLHVTRRDLGVENIAKFIDLIMACTLVLQNPDEVLHNAD